MIFTLSMGIICFLIGMAWGYFSCAYINQFSIKAGRAAISKAEGGAA